jgi:hypothetical protein
VAAESLIDETFLHTLIVILSTFVWFISVIAFRKTGLRKHFFLMVGFTFLLAFQVESLCEALFLSGELIVVPLAGTHLSHLLILFSLIGFFFALITGENEFGK